MFDAADEGGVTPTEIEALFQGPDGFRFARWGRPVVPVIFGVEEETLSVFKGAIEALCTLANHPMAETDPELGVNLMFFFLRDWQEMAETPNLDQLLPGLDALVKRLKAADADQYRAFRFDDAGAIQACFVFIRASDDILAQPADAIALSQAAQAMLVWGDDAFRKSSPLARVPETGTTIMRPEIADLIRVAYDPALPASASDPALALRLMARMKVSGDA